MCAASIAVYAPAHTDSHTHRCAHNMHAGHKDGHVRTWDVFSEQPQFLFATPPLPSPPASNPFSNPSVPPPPSPSSTTAVTALELAWQHGLLLTGHMNGEVSKFACVCVCVCASLLHRNGDRAGIAVAARSAADKAHERRGKYVCVCLCVCVYSCSCVCVCEPLFTCMCVSLCAHVHVHLTKQHPPPTTTTHTHTHKHTHMQVRVYSFSQSPQQSKVALLDAVSPPPVLLQPFKPNKPYEPLFSNPYPPPPDLQGSNEHGANPWGACACCAAADMCFCVCAYMCVLYMTVRHA
jgi:hypothetical protein